MDKTVILFFCGLGIGLFVGNLEFPSDLGDIETMYGRTIIAGTEVWLIIHYIVALTTLPVLAINYFKQRTKPLLKGLPFAFNAGFLCSSISMGLIHILTQIVTT